jgi:hypothetical protein
MTKADILKALDDLGWAHVKTDQDDRTMARRGVAILVAMVLISHIGEDDLADLQRTIEAKLAQQEGPVWLSPSVH